MSLVAINWKPDHRQLTQFGWIGLVAFGALGALAYFRHSILYVSMSEPTAHTVGYVLWALGGACGLLSLVAPMALRPLFIALSVVGSPIGYAVSYLVMFIVFYLVLTPIGLIFRLIGRDALHRRFDRSAASYWIRREPVTDVKRYYRQF